MTVESKMTENNTTLTVAVMGKFDFTLLNEFREAYSTEDSSFSKVIIDMRETSTIDSSALGMLLNMQRYLKDKNTEINIINCNADVARVFNITHFEEKFIIR